MSAQRGQLVGRGATNTRAAAGDNNHLTGEEIGAKDGLVTHGVSSLAAILSQQSLSRLRSFDGEHAAILSDDGQHNLIGAATNGEQARIAEVARNGILFYIAHATVELHAGIGNLARETARFQFRHRYL